MLFAWWLVWVVAGYLYGSVSFALIFTRLRTGQDIRTLGNRNAGAANVRRSVGFSWGALVFLLDLSKGLLPIYLASLTLSPDTSDPIAFAVFLTVGIAAFYGHCRPIYYGFRGGRGIATSIGVYAAFVPVEVVAAMLISALLVMLFVHNVEHRLGPYTPIGIVVLTPLFSLLSTLVVSTGGRIPGIQLHPWYVVAGMFFFSLVIFVINRNFVRERGEELRSPPADDSTSD